MSNKIQIKKINTFLAVGTAAGVNSVVLILKFGSGEDILELIACVEMKQSPEHWGRRAFISIVMYIAIHRYDDQAFDDMSEESEKQFQRFIVQKLLWPVPSQGIVEQSRPKK